MDWKIFKITYNDGGWHSGELPHFYYIAKSEEEVIANSQRYADFLRRKNTFGGDIWIHDYTGIESPYDWENLNDFTIHLSVKEKTSNV